LVLQEAGVYRQPLDFPALPLEGMMGKKSFDDVDGAQV